ncbi:GNAT family N-acetyltransferase [Rhizobium lemnae]|uniref:GNAT family N-acetyltransferase n=1 Tax=Rhizobium lemnae TaxID=1214924 RepID=A0ABV8E9T8_9HYPH|nr:GNAT family N-acetyltransferase [Rhizobium lemnae]MCJ8506924.1 GNAT family N-acetyltransferase [Rhizobium lemnae]
MQDMVIQREAPRQPGVLRLLELSDAYVASLYPAESNHMLSIEELEADTVSFFVARRGKDVFGCASLVRNDDGTTEIKRMFVDGSARGLKLGKRLLDQLESEARSLAISIIRLETGIYQPEAIGLYRNAGYEEIPPFGDYKLDPLSLFMEKRLR